MTLPVRLCQGLAVIALGLAACAPTNNGADAGADAAVTPDAATQETGADATASALPNPNDWQAMGNPSAALTADFEGFGASSTQGTMVNATLGIGPIGAPANTYLLSLEFPAFLGGSNTATCRVGFTYDTAAGTYAFNGDAMLTEPCAISDGATRLTFTGATVDVVPTLGNLRVRINTTATGPLLAGSGTLSVVYPPR